MGMFGDNDDGMRDGVDARMAVIVIERGIISCCNRPFIHIHQATHPYPRALFVVVPPPLPPFVAARVARALSPGLATPLAATALLRFPPLLSPPPAACGQVLSVLAGPWHTARRLLARMLP